jgi:hypothetical protein
MLPCRRRPPAPPASPSLLVAAAAYIFMILRFNNDENDVYSICHSWYDPTKEQADQYLS